MKVNKKVLISRKKIWKWTGVVLAFAVIVGIGAYQYKQEVLAKELAEKILRFHVLANSDATKDQELKLQVRDAVGVYMQQELAEAESLAESRAIVAQDLDEIVKLAEKIVEENGFAYEVAASLARVDFPEKTYGSYGFPAGEYEALQVVIGEGKGQNWWCVMYPNMCFFNSVYEVVEEEAEESLQQVLTTEEYEAIMEDGAYRVEFKWLSFLKGER